MKKFMIDRVILFDGTQISKVYNWDKEVIINLRDTIKDELKNKYGANCVGDDFKIEIFTFRFLNNSKIEEVVINVNGEEKCDWLSSILKHNYVDFPYKNVIDERGSFLGNSLIFCDYFWRGGDKQLLAECLKKGRMFDAFNKNKIIDFIFELAKNSSDVIFVPYDLFELRTVDKYKEKLEKDSSILCKFVCDNPFTFCGDKLEVSEYFRDYIMRDFPDNLLEVNNNINNRKLIKRKY